MTPEVRRGTAVRDAKGAGIRFLRESFESYGTVYPAESAKAARFLRLTERSDALLRTCRPGHFTASALILDPPGSKILLVKHRKLGIWVQPGGHADGEADLLSAAEREVTEETGLKEFRSNGEILDLDIHPIPARPDEDAHDHYDVRFLFFADPSTPLVISDESDELRWISVEEVKRFTEDESLLRLLRKAAVRRP